jgi:hypothetical protein
MESNDATATISVILGTHQFQAPLLLGSDLQIEVRESARLDFNSLVNLNGHTLTIVGSGAVSFNNSVIHGPGGQIVYASAAPGAIVPEPASAPAAFLAMAILARGRRRHLPKPH